MKIIELFECLLCGVLVPEEETNDNICDECFDEWESWDTHELNEEYKDNSSN
jgi:hypothetical protein